MVQAVNEAHSIPDSHCVHFITMCIALLSLVPRPLVLQLISTRMRVRADCLSYCCCDCRGPVPTPLSSWLTAPLLHTRPHFHKLWLLPQTWMPAKVLLQQGPQTNAPQNCLLTSLRHQHVELGVPPQKGLSLGPLAGGAPVVVGTSSRRGLWAALLIRPWGTGCCRGWSWVRHGEAEAAARPGSHGS